MNIQKIDIDSLPENNGYGYYGEFGAVIGDCNEIIVEGNAGNFLVSADCFESSLVDGFPCVKPKPEMILAIGGFPKSDAEKLADEMGITRACASDVLYLRTRSRWTEELEIKLISSHNSGEAIDVMSFGVTSETQAQLYWQASKACQDQE